MREREPVRDGMAGVLKEHPLDGAGIDSLLAVHRHAHQVACLHREVQAAAIKLDRRPLHAEKFPDQA
jgi:hypothetical protein